VINDKIPAEKKHFQNLIQRHVARHIHLKEKISSENGITNDPIVSMPGTISSLLKVSYAKTRPRYTSAARPKIFHEQPRLSASPASTSASGGVVVGVPTAK